MKFILLLLAGMSFFRTAYAQDRFLFDQDSGSYWYNEQFVGDGVDPLLLELRTDGTIVSHRRPFTPIYYPGSVVPFASEDKMLFSYKGKLAVWYKYQSFFQKDGSSFERKNFFAENPELDCGAQLPKFCMYFPVHDQGIGDGAIVYDGDFNSKLWFIDGDGYREARDAEKWLIGEEDLDDVWLSPDRKTLYGKKKSGNETSFIAKSEDGTKSVLLDSLQDVLFSNSEVARTGSSVFAGVSSFKYDPMTFQFHVYFEFFRVNMTGPEPTAEKILTDDAEEYYSYTMLGVTDQSVTYVKNTDIIRSNFSGGEPEVLYHCESGQLSNRTFFVSGAQTSGTMQCGNKVIYAADDQVQEFSFDFVPSASGVVENAPYKKTIMAVGQGKVGVIRPDRQVNAQYSVASKAPEFLRSWLEGDLICGVQGNEEAGQYRCVSRDGDWVSRTGDFLVTRDVVKKGNRWWMISSDESHVVLSRLEPSGNQQWAWVSVANMDHAESRGIRFVETNEAMVALDLQDSSIYLFENEELVPGYQHDRVDPQYFVFTPVLDADGRFYDLCEPEPQQAFICVFQRDGTKVKTDYVHNMYVTSPSYVLKRGALIDGFFVFRGEKHILLTSLYGELGSDFSSFHLPDDTVGFYVNNNTQDSDNLSIWTYDGIRFTGQNKRAAPAKMTMPKNLRKFFDDSDSGSSTTSNSSQMSHQYVFQDESGYWVRMNTSPYTYESAKTLVELMDGVTLTERNSFSGFSTNGTQTFVINSEGVWGCSAENFDDLGATPIARSCSLMARGFGFKKVSYVDGKLIALRGKALLELNPAEFLQRGSTIALNVLDFEVNGEDLTWTDGEALMRKNLLSGSTASYALGQTYENATVHGDYVCAAKGLLKRSTQGFAQLLGSCDAISGDSTMPLVVSQGSVKRCNGESCQDVAAIPLDWGRDSVFFANEAGNATIAYASEIFHLNAGASVFTPASYSSETGQNMLFAPITAMDEHFVSTAGGGVLRLDPSSSVTGLLRFE